MGCKRDRCPCRFGEQVQGQVTFVARAFCKSPFLRLQRHASRMRAIGARQRKSSERLLLRWRQSLARPGPTPPSETSKGDPYKVSVCLASAPSSFVLRQHAEGERLLPVECAANSHYMACCCCSSLAQDAMGTCPH